MERAKAQRKWLEANPDAMERMGIDDPDDLSPNQLAEMSEVQNLELRLGRQKLQEIQMEQVQGAIDAQRRQEEYMEAQMGRDVQKREALAEIYGRGSEQSEGAALGGGPTAAPPMSAQVEAILTGREEELYQPREGAGAPYVRGAGEGELYVPGAGAGAPYVRGAGELRALRAGGRREREPAKCRGEVFGGWGRSQEHPPTPGRRADEGREGRCVG